MCDSLSIGGPVGLCSLRRRSAGGVGSPRAFHSYSGNLKHSVFNLFSEAECMILLGMILY